jgi:hypothetical protein
VRRPLSPYLQFGTGQGIERLVDEDAEGYSVGYGQRMATCQEGWVRVDPLNAVDNRQPCCMEASVHGLWLC